MRLYILLSCETLSFSSLYLIPHLFVHWPTSSIITFVQDSFTSPEAVFSITRGKVSPTSFTIFPTRFRLRSRSKRTRQIDEVYVKSEWLTKGKHLFCCLLSWTYIKKVLNFILCMKPFVSCFLRFTSSVWTIGPRAESHGQMLRKSKSTKTD